MLNTTEHLESGQPVQPVAMETCILAVSLVDELGDLLQVFLGIYHHRLGIVQLQG